MRISDWSSDVCSSDLGGTTTPKVGVLWSPTRSFDVRASWGRSFKAPTLTQQYQAQMLYLYPASILGGGGAGAPPDSQSIFFWGGDPDLRPETAETVSVGFVARPDALPGLRLEANWFQIDYTDRVLPPKIGRATSELQSLMRISYAV